MSKLVLCYTKKVGVTQALGLDFDSVCVLSGGVTVAVGDSGAFLLDSGDDDNGSDIDTFAEFAMTDFGTSQQKRVRKAVVGFESSGALMISVKGDEGSFAERALEPDLGSSREEGVVVPVGREVKGRFLTVKIENTLGCDFSLDAIDLELMLLSKKAGRVRHFLPFLSGTLPSLSCSGTGA